MPTRTGNVLSWASILEENTMHQSQQAAKLPFIDGYVALMPDAHLGKGSTVGSVIPTLGAIVPSFVGVDLGCGCVASKTDMFASGLPDNLDKMLSWIEQVVPAGVGRGHEEGGRLNVTLAALLYKHHSEFTTEQMKKTISQFGSLGSGNHFVEICLDQNDQVWVVLHSGSRGIGNQLATQHINKAKGMMKAYLSELPDPDMAYFVEGTPEFDEYITDMLWAQQYALGNREAMMDAVLRQFWAWVGVGNYDWVGHELLRLNPHHNYTQKEFHNGHDVWITRKGAISAKEGELGIIPGSMGAATYIVRGKGNPASFNSCSHGAGRVMGRKQAERVLDVKQLEKAMEGKVWNSASAEKLIDESPQAYKSIDVIMEDSKDLVSIEYTLHQILNFKGVS